MDNSVQQAWDRLTESRLVDKSHVSQLRSRYQSSLATGEANGEIWKWLVAAGALTEFQASLLSAGITGPFRFENYLMLERIAEGPLQGTFLARHLSSQHRVHLDFFASQLPDAQDHWHRFIERAKRLATSVHPVLVATFDAVTLPDYAFVVSDVVGGQTIERKLPRKARLSWQQAATIGARVASAISELQRLDLVHGAISPRTVWLSGKLQARLRMNWRPDLEFDFVLPETEESKHDYLAPELLQGHPPTIASDLYAIGCLLHRIISGRSLTQGVSVDEKIKFQLFREPRDLSKYDVATSLQQLINSLLQKKPTQRPTDPSIVARMLCELSGQSVDELLPKIEAPATLVALRKALIEETPIVLASRPAAPAELKVNLHTGNSTSEHTPVTRKPLSPSEMIALRRTRKRRMAVAVLSSMFLLAITMGLVALKLSGNRFQRPTVARETRTPQTELAPDSSRPVDGSRTKNANTNSDGAAIIQQDLTADDGQRLWESPTTGRPTSFAFLPPGPRIVISLRPHELFSIEQGKLLVQACGPELNSLIASWSESIAVPVDQISQLTVGLYPGPSKQYVSLAIIRLDRALSRDEIRQRWQASPLSPDDEKGILVRGNDAFLPFLDSSADADAGDEISGFVFGPRDLVLSAAETSEAMTLSGPLAPLGELSDDQRHFNFLFTPAAIFNDEGQWLMSGLWGPVNRRLRAMFDESTRAVMLSVHFDEGCYVEVTFSNSVDVSASEIQSRISERLRLARDEVTSALAATTANRHWERVRLRFDNMLADAYRNLRVGVERRQVIANCWLPPMAAHNLIAAAELALSFGDVVTVVETGEPGGPTSIEELLALPRTLTVTTNPDLSILMQNITQEVVEQYPSLSFEFRIEISGNDLLREGITKNQRPGDFTLENTPLSEILTQIVVRANPDKAATGPSDPRCKLIWVLAENPDAPGQKIIQITTRAAATERNLKLPDQFVPPNSENK